MRLQKLFLLKESRAFSLVEMAIVLVVLSILTTTVLAGSSLITRAQINKIQEEHHNFKAALMMFRDTYGCMPGACRQNRIVSLQRRGLSPKCFNTDNIDIRIRNAVQRSCMMHSLMLAGHLEDVDPQYNTLAQLGDSISGKNIPHARFNKKASWDYRVMNVPGNSGATATMPIEITNDNQRKLKHLLLLRGSNYSSNDANKSYDIVVPSSPDANGVVYAISADLARRLDAKFDDALPSTGNVRSGRIYNNSPACYASASARAPSSALAMRSARAESVADTPKAIWTRTSCKHKHLRDANNNEISHLEAKTILEDLEKDSKKLYMLLFGRNSKDMSPDTKRLPFYVRDANYNKQRDDERFNFDTRNNHDKVPDPYPYSTCPYPLTDYHFFRWIRVSDREDYTKEYSVVDTEDNFSIGVGVLINIKPTTMPDYYLLLSLKKESVRQIKQEDVYATLKYLEQRFMFLNDGGMYPVHGYVPHKKSFATEMYLSYNSKDDKYIFDKAGIGKAGMEDRLKLVIGSTIDPDRARFELIYYRKSHNAHSRVVFDKRLQNTTQIVDHEVFLAAGVTFEIFGLRLKSFVDKDSVLRCIGRPSYVYDSKIQKYVLLQMPIYAVYNKDKNLHARFLIRNVDSSQSQIIIHDGNKNVTVQNQDENGFSAFTYHPTAKDGKPAYYKLSPSAGNTEPVISETIDQDKFQKEFDVHKIDLKDLPDNSGPIYIASEANKENPTVKRLYIHPDYIAEWEKNWQGSITTIPPDKSWVDAYFNDKKQLYLLQMINGFLPKEEVFSQRVFIPNKQPAESKADTKVRQATTVLRLKKSDDTGQQSQTSNNGQGADNQQSQKLNVLYLENNNYMIGGRVHGSETTAVLNGHYILYNKTENGVTTSGLFNIQTQEHYGIDASITDLSPFIGKVRIGRGISRGPLVLSADGQSANLRHIFSPEMRGEPEMFIDSNWTLSLTHDGVTYSLFLHGADSSMTEKDVSVFLGELVKDDTKLRIDSENKYVMELLYNDDNKGKTGMHAKVAKIDASVWKDFFICPTDSFCQVLTKLGESRTLDNTGIGKISKDDKGRLVYQQESCLTAACQQEINSVSYNGGSSQSNGYRYSGQGCYFFNKLGNHLLPDGIFYSEGDHAFVYDTAKKASISTKDLYNSKKILATYLKQLGAPKAELGKMNKCIDIARIKAIYRDRVEQITKNLEVLADVVSRYDLQHADVKRLEGSGVDIKKLLESLEAVQDVKVFVEEANSLRNAIAKHFVAIHDTLATELRALPEKMEKHVKYVIDAPAVVNALAQLKEERDLLANLLVKQGFNISIDATRKLSDAIRSVRNVALGVMEERESALDTLISLISDLKKKITEHQGLLKQSGSNHRKKSYYLHWTL